MIVTLFDNLWDNAGHEWDVGPADFLRTLVAAPAPLNRAEKARALAFCGCRFDGTRAKHNARDLSVIALDVDDGAADWFDASFELDDLGCAYALYTTTKHRWDHNRYRIVIPLSASVGGDDYARVWNWFSRFLASHGIIVDRATSDISRMSIAPHLWEGQDDKGGEYADDDNEAQRAIARPDWPLFPVEVALAATTEPDVVTSVERQPDHAGDYRKWQNWHVTRDVLSDLDISPIVPRARLETEMSSTDSGRTFRFLCGCAVKAVAGGYDVDETVLRVLGLEFSRRVGRKPDGLARDARNALMRARTLA